MLGYDDKFSISEDTKVYLIKRCLQLGQDFDKTVSYIYAKTGVDIKDVTVMAISTEDLNADLGMRAKNIQSLCTRRCSDSEVERLLPEILKALPNKKIVKGDELKEIKPIQWDVDEKGRSYLKIFNRYGHSFFLYEPNGKPKYVVESCATEISKVHGGGSFPFLAIQLAISNGGEVSEEVLLGLAKGQGHKAGLAQLLKGCGIFCFDKKSRMYYLDTLGGGGGIRTPVP